MKTAYRAYRRHVLQQCKTGDPKLCQACRDLERQASAEMWKRTTDLETAGVR